MNRTKWFIFVAAVITLLIVLYSARIVVVLDHDTLLPVANAKIQIATVEFLRGCSPDGIIFQTSFFGIATLNGRQMSHVCSLRVEKSGYHPNGQNASFAINLPPWIQIIRLQKIKNTQPLIVKGLDFQQGDKADFLSIVGTQDETKLRAIPKEIVGPASIDFDFPIVSNTEAQANTFGSSIITIRFYGDGGVQQIPGGDVSTNVNYRQYALENLIEAPTSDYKKELSLESGGQYVARLRDGKHYMKFYVFGSKYNNGQNYAALTFFIQPNELPFLESIQSDDVFVSVPKTASPSVSVKNIPFSINAPKDGNTYFYDEDVLFSGTAPVDSIVHISMPENQSTATVKPDMEGKWMTFLGDRRTIGSGHETSWSVCLTDCPSAEAVTTRNVTISNGDKSYTIHYDINKERSGSRKVYFGYFSLDIPGNLIPKRGGSKDSLGISFCNMQTCLQEPNLFSIGIWLGDDTDLLAATRKFSARYSSHYETFSLGKLTGYKVPENNPPSNASTVFLGYKNILVSMSTTVVQPDFNPMLVQILDSLQPLSP